MGREARPKQIDTLSPDFTVPGFQGFRVAMEEWHQRAEAAEGRVAELEGFRAGISIRSLSHAMVFRHDAVWSDEQDAWAQGISANAGLYEEPATALTLTGHKARLAIEASD